MVESFKRIPELTLALILRFKRKLREPNEKGCILWRGKPDKSGYGQINIENIICQTHRVAYLIATGIDPGPDKVLHKCNTRRCCNPEHLYLGTQADNNKDRKDSGRNGNQKGENNNQVKLNDEIVKWIRESHLSAKTIAKQLGVVTRHIYNIRSGGRWKHLSVAQQCLTK